MSKEFRADIAQTHQSPTGGNINKNYLILFVLLVCAIGVYYFSQNLNKLISPSDAEQILNKQMRDTVASMRQDIDSDLQIEWDTFTCNSNLKCVSPNITLKERDKERLHLKNTTITLHNITLNQGQIEFSTLFALDDNMIKELESETTNSYTLLKPFIPSKFSCMIVLGVDGAKSLSENNFDCSMITPSADYKLVFNMDLIHPLYKDENFIAVMKDEQGKFSDDKLMLEQMDQALIGLRQLALKVQSKSLPQALYQLALASDPDLKQEDLAASAKQDIDMIATFITFGLQNSSLETQEQQQLTQQLNNLTEGIKGIITGDKKELTLDMSLKDTKNIKRFSAAELDDPTILVQYYNFNANAQ